MFEPPEFDILFEVKTPLGFRVRVTVEHWKVITTVKHPVIRGRGETVRATLSEPDEVYQSKNDPQIMLFYQAHLVKRWVCAVTKQTGDDGFLITAYPTKTIKEGTLIWCK